MSDHYEATSGRVFCAECGQGCPDMHHLVDHITDDHDLYSWVTAGRPVEHGEVSS